LLLLSVPTVLALTCTGSNVLADAKNTPGLCTHVLAKGLKRPRGLFITPENNILVVEADKSRIISLFDDDDDGAIDAIVPIAKGPDLNHGLVVFNGHLYASSEEIVYRWNYREGQRTVSKTRVIVIRNIPSGGHWTRTLVFDVDGNLYISVGSRNNIDKNSDRSRIRRFPMYTKTKNGVLKLKRISKKGLNFEKGEIFADGLRNEVGLAFDKYQTLWGVENSADQLERADLGGDIHNDNPAEELNRFDKKKKKQKAKFYGYPYCWTEYRLPQGLPGRIWSQPGSGKTDSWCRKNSVAPVLPFQAHSAPLGITFYDPTFSSGSSEGTGCVGDLQALPQEWHDHAFIGFHGSWNRDIPTGYKVVRVPMSEGGVINGVDTPVVDVLSSAGSGATWESGFRPVDVKFDRCGRLIVTDDGDGSVVIIGSNGNSASEEGSVEGSTEASVEGSVESDEAGSIAPQSVAIQLQSQSQLPQSQFSQSCPVSGLQQCQNCLNSVQCGTGMICCPWMRKCVGGGGQCSIASSPPTSTVLFQCNPGCSDNLNPSDCSCSSPDFPDRWLGVYSDQDPQKWLDYYSC